MSPPKAIFDNAEFLKNLNTPGTIPVAFKEDYRAMAQFLLSYQHNEQTFKTYRREVERFAQWAWHVAKKSSTQISRIDIEDYLVFCQKPPMSWIGSKTVARFLETSKGREPSDNWRPFVATISKSSRAAGQEVERHKYQLSEKGFREIFTIINSYFNFLIQENLSPINPVAQIKQKSRFYRKFQGKTKIRRISEMQWSVVIETAEKMATREPEKHERTLFIISILYGMYLRISELAASARWSPSMNDFERDHEGRWWFTTVGKGNKERKIAVSEAMLKALERWRKYLNCSPALPTSNDNSALIPKINGRGPVTDTRHIRRIVQACFDEAVNQLRAEKLDNDAEELAQATVHWLRHTGISDDVKFRPREHVRDDAGHSSSSITDKYIDINLQERHLSAKKKLIRQE